MKDLITLEVGRAVARIGTHVVRLSTCMPLDLPENNFRDMIVDQSHAKYCRPTSDVKKAVATRDQRWQAPLAERIPEGNGNRTARARRSGRGERTEAERGSDGYGDASYEYEEL